MENLGLRSHILFLYSERHVFGKYTVAAASDLLLQVLPRNVWEFFKEAISCFFIVVLNHYLNILAFEAYLQDVHNAGKLFEEKTGALVNTNVGLY